MRIVCSHEHYIALNLPLIPSIPPSPSPSIGSMQSYSSNNTNTMNNNNNNGNNSINVSGNNQRTISVQQTDLTYEFRQEHYLVGNILEDLQNVLSKK